jgi:hypothetical protein
VEHISSALVSAGDRAVVDSLLAERRHQRSGAARQRLLRERLDQQSFVAALAAASLRESSQT